MSKVKAKRLGDIVNFKRGYDLPAYQRKQGNYPVVSSSGISGYHSEYKADGEGIITGRYGTLGEMHYVNGKYWPHNTALYITDFKGNYPKYVYYLLKCLGNLKTSDKSAVPGVNRNDLHELFVPYIADGQKAIAAVLSSIDQKIEINNRINTELEAMAKTLYDYWFVQFDFPDENGKPYKSSGGKMVYSKELKQEIPAGWEAAPLRKYLSCNQKKLGNKHDLKKIQYLDTANLTRNIIGITQCLDVEKDEVPSRANMIVSKNDILYSTVRPNQHHYGLMRNPIENMIASTGFSVLTHKLNSAFNSVFFLYLTSDNNRPLAKVI